MSVNPLCSNILTNSENFTKNLKAVFGGSVHHSEALNESMHYVLRSKTCQPGASEACAFTRDLRERRDERDARVRCPKFEVFVTSRPSLVSRLFPYPFIPLPPDPSPLTPHVSRPLSRVSRLTFHVSRPTPHLVPSSHSDNSTFHIYHSTFAPYP